MKKLMFAAAAAAMIGGVEAAGYVDCFGVYDFSATLKTTKGVLSTLKTKSNPCIEEDTKAYVRKQATVKIAGLIWGCDCETIATPAPFTGFRYNGEGPYDGSAFWNVTDKTGYDVFGDDAYNTLAWTVLNRIDTTAAKTEGIWNLTLAAYDSDGNETPEFYLIGAGFGTAKGELEGDCGNSHVYIPSMSGYVVGQRYYTCLSDKESWGPCQDPSSTTYDLLWWALCDCAEDDTSDTVAYGSWTIKFNQSITNKGAKEKYSGMNENVYKFPAYILPQLLAYDPDPDPTECDVLAAAVTAREADVKTAEAAVEAVTYENLTKAVAEAGAAEYVAETNSAALYIASTNANEIYQASDAAYEKALYQQTNVNWTITFKNASQLDDTRSGVGCVALTAAIDELQYFTLIKMETTIPGLYGIRTCTTWAQCTALVKEFTDATEAAAKTLATDKANLVTAEANYVSAKAAYEDAQSATALAKNRLSNITYLQVEAAKALSNAQDALTAAKAAYAAVCED